MRRRFVLAAACLLALGGLGYSAHAASNDGDHGILFVRDRGTGADVFLWKAGKPLRLTWGATDSSSEPAWSPDGRLVAFVGGTDPGYSNDPPANCVDVNDCRMEIWLMRPNGSHKRLLTKGADWSTFPSWSPDGRRIVFDRGNGRARSQLAVISLRTGRQRSFDVGDAGPAVWGLHGIAYRDLDGVRLLNPRTGRSTRLVRVPDGFVDAIAWSPNGGRLAVIAQWTETRGLEIPPLHFLRVTIYSDTGERLGRFPIRPRHSGSGACAVSWSPDGTRLLVTVQLPRTGYSLYQVDAKGTNWRRLPVSGAGCGTSWR